jgi:hypothetical protein
MTLLWTLEEQQAIKKVSPNRIGGTFNVLAEETQISDLKPLLGNDMFQNMLSNPSETWNKNLLDGGTYNVGSMAHTFSGLKYVLSYFFYARYIEQSNEFDTYIGIVEKNNQDSNHLMIGAIKNRANSIRQIAFKYWEECEAFISANNDKFKYYGVTCDRKRNIYYL